MPHERVGLDLVDRHGDGVDTCRHLVAGIDLYPHRLGQIEGVGRRPDDLTLAAVAVILKPHAIGTSRRDGYGHLVNAAAIGQRVAQVYHPRHLVNREREILRWIAHSVTHLDHLAFRVAHHVGRICHHRRTELARPHQVVGRRLCHVLGPEARGHEQRHRSNPQQ